jgi:hypothetical protein
MSKSGPACTHCNDTKRIAMFLPGSWAPCDWCAPKATAEVEPEDEDDEILDTITINGEVCELNGRLPHSIGHGGMQISTDSGEFIVFETQEAAGQAARAYWADMAANDPNEFACYVSAEVLTA